MTRIVQTVGELDSELEADARRTWARWTEIRRGPMRAYVLAELAASRHSATREYAALAALLGPAWYPVQTDHPFPAWRRDSPGEAPEVLIELALSAVVAACDTDHDIAVLPHSGVLLVYPTLLADFLVAFDREHTVDRLAAGRYLHHLRQYQGPGGSLYRRPFVYHGPNQGWSAGEIRVSFGPLS